MRLASLYSNGLSCLSFLQCKLEFHACSTGKSLNSLCDGPCPCLPEPEPLKPKAEKSGEWKRVQRSGALRGQTWLTCSEPGCDRAVQPVKGIWSHLASKLSSLARDSELNHFLPLKRERRAERLLKEICQSKVCAGLL
jgi:hypothetical protein